MTEPMNDDERLAALMDKRLDPRQREELLAQLAASEDERRVLADAAALLRELEERGELEEEEEEAGAGVEAAPSAEVIPLRPRARGWRSPSRWMPVAAVLAGLALIPVLMSRTDAQPGDPVRLAAELELAPGEGLPEGWRPPWPLTRGEGAPPGATAAARTADAVQAGVLMLDLAVAVRARDTADVQLLTERVRRRFGAEVADTSLLRQISARAGARAASLEPLLRQATKRLAERLGAEPLEVGAWAEAGRLAARRRDEGFFRRASTGGMLERAERLAARNADAREALARIRAALGAGGPPAWDALEQDLATLLGEIAS